jgi:hypothetical protein
MDMISLTQLIADRRAALERQRDATHLRRLARRASKRVK